MRGWGCVVEGGGQRTRATGAALVGWGATLRVGSRLRGLGLMRGRGDAALSAICLPHTHERALV